jgi:hypothetical protein
MTVRLNRLADEIANRFGDHSDRQVEGNAALLLAAPELLAALKEVAEGCESRLRKGKDSGDLETLRLCRAAINKAEGRGE